MVLFAFFAAMAETERENIRDATLEGLTAAARKGVHGGRPPVITDMLHTVLRRRANGESVEQIRPALIIPTGWAITPARPASTGRLPSTTRRRRTPRPPTKPTPTSPPSRRVPDGPIIAGQPYPPDFRRLLRRPRVDSVMTDPSPRRRTAAPAPPTPCNEKPAEVTELLRATATGRGPGSATIRARHDRQPASTTGPARPPRSHPFEAGASKPRRSSQVL